MPLFFVEGDITKLKVDAIVNAANNSLLGGGGVDGCIHRAAGPELVKECATLRGCETGKAKITKGYRLPASYVIHTVGPIWSGGYCHEKELLESCYSESLELAVKNKCSTIAFPLISAGAYGYPVKEAFNVAVETIQKFLNADEYNNELAVYIVFYDKSINYFNSNTSKIISNIADYISSNIENDKNLLTNVFEAKETIDETYCNCSVAEPIKEYLLKKEKSFSEKLLELIEIKGLTEPECYNKANITRQTYNKIKNNICRYQKKTTVLAFAFALKLDIDEAQDLLKSAGFAFSCSRFDLIIQYMIEHEVYNIIEVNEVLHEFGEPQLGSGFR